MNNKKPPVPQCPSVPVEEEIEEDLKAIDETETPLLTGNNKFVFIVCVMIKMKYCFRSCDCH